MTGPDMITSGIDDDRQADIDRLRRLAAEDPDAFWGEQGRILDWIRPYSVVSEARFTDGADIRWYEDGILNVAANCIDRHLAERGDQTAILWEGDNPEEHRAITYRALHEEVCRLANVLKAFGVERGDRVTIYLPMIPEAAFAMLACARLGAIHSVVFGGFSAESLANRIADCGARVVITADGGYRGGKHTGLKSNVDKALDHCEGGHSDVYLGRVADTPVYIGAAQFEYWAHTQLTIDVVPGRGAGFSLEPRRVSVS